MPNLGSRTLVEVRVRGDGCVKARLVNVTMHVPEREGKFTVSGGTHEYVAWRVIR